MCKCVCVNVYPLQNMILQLILGVSYATKLYSLILSQECPSGIVNEETFKDIYAQFFPQGGGLC